MSELKKVCIYCASEGSIVSEWTANDTIAVCPNNPAHTLVADSAYIDTESTEDVRYYRLDNGPAALGNVVSITPHNELSVGFGSAPKYTFCQRPVAACATCTLSATQFVVVYTDTMSTPTANAGAAVLCTIVGNTVECGQPVIFSGAGGTALTSISVIAINSTDIMIAWRAAATGAIVFGQASNTGVNGTIAFGIITSFNSSAPGNQSGSIVALRLTATQVVVVYRDTNNSNRGTWITATLSGSGVNTSAVWNTKTTFNAVNTANNQYALSADVLDSTRFIVAFDNNSTAAAAIVGVVAGTGIGATITAGAMLNNIDTNNTKLGRDLAICTLDSSRAVLFYRRTIDNISTGRAVVLSIDGSNNITAGTPVDYTDTAGIQSPSAILYSANRVVVSYIGTNTANSLESSIVDISGTTITVTMKGCVHAASATFNTLSKCGNWLATTFRDGQYYNMGVAMIYDVQGDMFEFYEGVGTKPIGVAMHAANSNDMLAVFVGRRANFYSGLVAGSTYYAHGDGAVNLSFAATNSQYVPQEIGIAESATQMLLYF